LGQKLVIMTATSTRRDWLRQLPALAGTTVLRAEEIVEEQRGDPDLPGEVLRIDKAVLDDVLSPHSKAEYQPYKRDFPEALVEKAATLVGSSRQGTPKRIGELLSMYRLPLKYSSGFVPFCAAGVGYSAALAYADLIGRPEAKTRVTALQQLLADIEHWYYYPTVSCRDMRLVEMGKRRWVDAHPARPAPRRGWVVLYAWNNPEKADHCGIVAGGSSGYLQTIEFNTSGTVNGSQINGGAVVMKRRPYDRKVMGFIATDRVPQF
jgi:hypothetical protein